MKRLHSFPALTIATLFSFGILIGKKIDLPTAFLFAIATTCVVVAIIYLVRTRTRKDDSIALSICLLVLILSVGAFKISVDSDSSSSSTIRTTGLVEVTGRVIEPPTRFNARTRFTLKALVISDSGEARSIETNTLVTVTRRKRDSVEVVFPYGSIVRLKGQIGRPSAERNPGEFDARKYYEAQGVSFVMRVKGYENIAVIDSNSIDNAYTWLMKRVVVPVRSYMLALIDQTVGGEEGELLKGIYIGERGGIPFATRTAFANSGISHILAVSGSNVIVVLLFCSILFNLLRMPRSLSIVLTLAAILFYMLLTGSQPPIVRATVMAFVFQLGKLLGEKSNGLNSLGVSALLILGYDARQFFDVGFQLSFAAVLSLVYLYPIAVSWLPSFRRGSWWRKLIDYSAKLVVATFVATVGTLPMIAVYFGRVSIVGLLTNVLVVPLVGASVVLGFISSLTGWASLFVADAFAATNQWLLTGCLWIAELSGGLSWAYVETLQFKSIHSLPFYALLGFAFHIQLKRVAVKFLLLFLASLNLLLIVPDSAFEKSSKGMLRVSFIDVGQGDAALVEFPTGKTMLIDAGPKSAEYDAGERIVTPFLLRRGIAKLDYVVASHPHADHIGGLPYVFPRFDVGELIESGQPARDPIYLDYMQAARDGNCRQTRARAGLQPIVIDGARWYFIYPTETIIDADTTHADQNLNNTSVVVKLTYGETSILFAGDTERDAEEEMVKMFGSVLRSSILKVGHHGSNTSSSQEFLDAVNPTYAIVSVGLNNKFNHPSEDVLQRLALMGVETLRTDEEGAIIFESDGKIFQRVIWRE